MESHSKKLLIAFCTVGITFFLINYFNLSHYLTISYLHSHMHVLHTFIDNYYLYSVVCYLVSFIVATTFSIPGSSIFTIAAGLLFGWPGLFYSLLAATIGATLLFLAVRYLIGRWVQHRYATRLAGFNQEIEAHGQYYLLIVRLIAVLPFCLVNMLSGLTMLSLRSFVGVTLVGLVPVSAVYVFAGKQLAQLASPNNFFSPSVIFAFAIFVIFKAALIPAVFTMFKRFFNLIKNRKKHRFGVGKKIDEDHDINIILDPSEKPAQKNT